MKVYQKWNYENHKYDDYLVPDDKILKTYSNDMNEIVNCCQCLKEMTFGEGYTSMEVHTPVLGFGYCVCEECYQKEMERRLNDERAKRIEKAYQYLDKFVPNEYGYLLTERQWNYIKELLKGDENDG